MKKRKLAVVGKNCVACGVCELICPRGAIKVSRGVRAVVDDDKCIGCTKCEKACPAGIIEMKTGEGALQ